MIKTTRKKEKNDNQNSSHKHFSEMKNQTS